jgi:hypothetical protein
MTTVQMPCDSMVKALRSQLNSKHPQKCPLFDIYNFPNFACWRGRKDTVKASLVWIMITHQRQSDKIRLAGVQLDAWDSQRQVENVIGDFIIHEVLKGFMKCPQEDLMKLG